MLQQVFGLEDGQTSAVPSDDERNRWAVVMDLVFSFLCLYALNQLELI